ncbi:putative Signal transduction response regulator, receiver and diguanylate cyclase domain [Nitrospira tepida]|uniref:Signal transduction response regulator, receiver and diguanylate cyclase domain n=1 Tax=Nitrospira tepida TaxID=2973512 RepID=A0AA86MWC1_9BACT|nr:GGDEF domain-containing response regulator [Nitrospira tepida]CAI4030181.1 putative Signal transduction response regulator, receiver and diguanylate cyclase domain [Nitrospira tepida]
MLKILLVEDNPVDAQLAQDILSDWSADQFQISHVPDLTRALASLSRDRFDAVLLDLSLPDGQGLKTLTLVQETSPGIPIVVLSGYADQAAALQAVQQGAQDYLVKGQIQGDLLARSIRYSIERKRTEERLTYLAQYDQLTGLVNRALFQDRLVQAIARSRRTQQGFALMLLDLDGFKAVNDSLGHDAGDLVLKIVADRLKNCVREVDTVARMGGDEFTIILEGTATEQGAETVATRIIQSIKQPCALPTRQATVGVSLGITLFPQDDQSADGLLKQADSAMYLAKQQGGTRFAFFRSQAVGRRSSN